MRQPSYMQSLREPELDVVKGIGIVFVVIVHMHFSNKVMNHYIGAFVIEMFFFISGILYKPKPIRETLKGKARALLSPYACFGALYWVIYNIQKYLPRHSTKKMLPTLKALLFFPTTSLPIENTLWFLPVMFITTVVYCCLDHWIRNETVLSCVMLAVGAVGFALPKFINYRLLWGLDAAMHALLFYHLGRLAGQYGLIDGLYAAKRKNRGLFYLSLIVVLVINTWLIFVNGKVNVRSTKWAIIPLTLVNALTATILYIVLSKLLVDNPKLKASFPVKWMEHVGMTSIIYLCTNHPVIKDARRIAKWIAADAPRLQILLTFAISMALMYGISELILKTKLRVIVGKR